MATLFVEKSLFEGTEKKQAKSGLKKKKKTTNSLRIWNLQPIMFWCDRI